jgi:outer membrane protein
MTGSAFAEKVAVVDVGKVFDGYVKTKENDEVLTAEGKKKQQERDTMVQEVRKLKDEQALLSDKAKEEKQGAIDDKIRQLQEFDNNVRRDLGGRRDTVIKEIFKDIDDLIRSYGKQKGYDYILNQRLILYSNEQLDVTTDILTELNATYAKQKGGAKKK